MLVIDDHPDTAETFAAIIRALGHEAEALQKPELVLAEIARFHPDVLFLDIGMPGMDGWTLSKQIRQTYPPGTIKLIAVTAYGAHSDRVKSREAGFDAHVAKPVDPEMIASILEQCFADPQGGPPRL